MAGGGVVAAISGKMSWMRLRLGSDDTAAVSEFCGF